MFTDRLMGQPGFKPMARRIIVPLDLSSVNSESVYCKIKDLNSNLSLELPNINYSKLNTLPYKYVYGANIYQNPLSIVKINVENDAEQWEFKFEKGEIPTEPVFIENPNPQSEDDGVLLVMCLATDNDYLLILDSKDLTEIARAVLPDEAKGICFDI
jgi:carotenoid cleavage dioxygenase-like enzyme